MLRTRTPSTIRFGIFEVDLSRRELRRRGTPIKLQDQPFEVLIALLEQPGAVVTRKQLQARLWRDDTFVDFDRGLNKAINRVREALGDMAATPRFVETVPRRGYRFIASIEVSATTSASHVIRSSILPPSGAAFFAPHFALSPDGARLAFVASDSTGKKSLWVRDLSAADAQPMRDTEDARLPFWFSRRTEDRVLRGPKAQDYRYRRRKSADNLRHPSGGRRRRVARR